MNTKQRLFSIEIRNGRSVESMSSSSAYMSPFDNRDYFFPLENCAI